MKAHSDGPHGEEHPKKAIPSPEPLTDKNWPFSKPPDDPQVKAWGVIDPLIGKLSSARKRKPKRGRPPTPTENTTHIHTIWTDLGRPPKWGGGLARKVYQGEYTKASAVERKRMREQCARAVERIEAKTPTKSEPE
jgi:hypothetical protein